MGAATTRVVQGTTTKVPISIARSETSASDIQIILTNAPSGITAGSLTIPSSASRGELEIAVNSAISQGPVTVTIEGHAVDVSDAQATTSANLQLFVRGPAGSLDTTFATDGWLINLLGGTLSPIDAFVSADDSILLLSDCTVGGSYATPTGTCVARLTPDGVLDPSYGDSGVAMLDDLSSGDAVILSDGSMVVGGSVNDIAAYGIIDTNGKSSTITNFPATTALGTTAGGVIQTALAPNDNVVMLFPVTDVNGNSVTGIAKVNANEFDTTFGTDGFANGNLADIFSDVTNATVQLSMAPHVAVRPNGKIVIMSTGLTGVDGGNPPLCTYLGFLQLESNGAHDTSFGPDGQTAFNAFGDAHLVLPMILPDGRILSIIQAFADHFISVFKADGTDFDRTFGDNGSLSMPGNFYGFWLFVAVDDQNRLIAASGNIPALEYVWRYTNDGKPDTSFGLNGQAITPSLAEFTYGHSFAARVQKDGRIVVATWAHSATTSQDIFVISRLWD